MFNLDISIMSVTPDKYAPIGDPTVGYPQLCIRTNRTAERTNLDEVIKILDAAADQYPIHEKEKRAKVVMEALVTIFSSGNLGHAWIIIFNSDQKGDYTSYAYHGDHGFVKNADSEEINDSPERKFYIQRCIRLTNPEHCPDKLEQTIIPSLNRKSYLMAKLMGMTVKNPANGAYTPINNCTWFAGELWNSITDEQLIYEQAFNGAAHAEKWGIDYLALITKIADPGMLAESLSKIK
ncbi:MULTISPECIES: hypothetical protein [Arsenophonus]|jgi:hypothetical protein|uniref:hypothetical protein n=2 Tax=Morganellaceae TaxID=1903414 RepID=UPI0015D83F5F|nr:hypothetical protein [Arsenophonus endosymbiont of Apis mellifera]